jgi:hypothetical protein
MYTTFEYICVVSLPITVAERSEVGTVFARSNAEIVGLNPSPVMDVYSAVVLSCVEVLGRADPRSKESYQLSIRPGN